MSDRTTDTYTIVVTGPNGYVTRQDVRIDVRPSGASAFPDATIRMGDRSSFTTILRALERESSEQASRVTVSEMVKAMDAGN